MTTSGTVTWRPNIEEVIDEAFERIGLDAQIITGGQARSARRSLNLMFSEWAVRGVNYWSVEEASLPLVQGQVAYELLPGTLDVLDMVIRRDGTDQQIARISLSDYHALPNKNSQGLPTQCFLDRQYTPRILLWQVPENSTDEFVYWRVSQLDDATISNQDADVPYRWSEAMCAGLAARLALKYAPDRVAGLEVSAERSFNFAADDERERATLKIVPASVV